MELLKLSTEDQERQVDRGELAVTKALASLKPPKPKAPKAPKVVPESTVGYELPSTAPVGYLILTRDEHGALRDDYDGEVYPDAESVWTEITQAQELGHEVVPVALVPLAPETVHGADEDDSEGSHGDITGAESESAPHEGPEASVEGPVSSADAPAVTVKPPQGVGGLCQVVCNGHGTITTLNSPEMGNRRAREHIEAEHGGVGRVVPQASLIVFARSWAQMDDADEDTVRDSAVFEFPDDGHSQDEAMKLWHRARELLAQRPSA